jgi:hypothetical protein
MVMLARIDPMYDAVEAPRVLANGSIVNGTVGARRSVCWAR